MRYPNSIINEVDIVRTIVERWPADIDIDVDDVLNWILQFDEEDFGLALRVIKSLNIIGQRDLERGLKVAYSKLMRKALERGSRIKSKNTLFAGIGEIGKSGSMISYYFRMTNPISEENFLSEDTQGLIERGEVENIVLIDDVVGTGRQASKEIKELTERVTPLGVKNIFLLTVCGMRDGLLHIEDETKAYTFSAFEYSANDTANSLDSSFYDGVPHESREALRRRLQEYGKVCYEKQPLGYGGLGGLLVFSYNCPNSTLPIVWSDANGWIPLFKRVRRINGIASYQKQFEKAVETKAAQNVQTKKETSQEITLFVEGKSDEIFFDELASKMDMSKILDAPSVSVVGLGMPFHSPRLVDMLRRVNPRSVFIIDDDLPRQMLEKFFAQSSGVPVVQLHPSLVQLLDLNKLLQMPEFADMTGPPPPKETPEYKELIREIEMRLLRKLSPDRRARMIKVLVEDYLDEKEVGDFIEILRTALATK